MGERAPMIGGIKPKMSFKELLELLLLEKDLNLDDEAIDKLEYLLAQESE